METIQKAFEAAIHDSLKPEKLVAGILRKRLSSEHQEISDWRLERAAEILLREGRVVLRHPWWKFWGKGVDSISIGEEAVEDLSQIVTGLLEGLPELVDEVTDSISKRILESPPETLLSYAGELRRADAEFGSGVVQRWAKPLATLRTVIAIGDEIATSVSAAVLEPDDIAPCFRECVLRLYSRASQTAKEVVVLLEVGLADGAMARWRSLHETAVVMLLITQHGDELAVRYLDHQVVDAYRSMMAYQRHREDLGFEAIDEVEVQRLSLQFRSLIQMYGDSFETEYGWAAEVIGRSRPTMKDLEEAANLSRMRPYYRLSSQNIHPSSRGVHYRLGLPVEDRLLAGPSPYGLEEPGQNTALSIAQCAAALSTIGPNLDRVVGTKVMFALACNACGEFCGVNVGGEDNRD